MASFDEGHGGGGKVIGEDLGSLYEERLFPLTTPARFRLSAQSDPLMHSQVLRRSRGYFTVLEGGNLTVETPDVLPLFFSAEFVVVLVVITGHLATILPLPLPLTLILPHVILNHLFSELKPSYQHSWGDGNPVA